MTKKKKVSKDTFITAAADMLNGTSIRKATKDYNMSQRDARWLSRNQGLTANEFREMVIDRLRTIMAEILEKIYEKLDDIAPGSLALTFGILSDKMQNFVTEIESQAPQKELGVYSHGKLLTAQEVRDLLIQKPRDSKEKSRNSSMFGNSQPDIIDCTPPEDNN